MKHVQDRFDIVRQQWKQERPDLDASGIEVVGRILFLSRKLRRSAARKLARLGLNLWGYDVLASLRRQGPPFRMSPTELSRTTLLSPAAMTNRLDRLEAAGWVQRQPDPVDRRSLLIELTPEGRDLVDEAAGVRLKEAIDSLNPLSESERRDLGDLLRRLLNESDETEHL
ncbi:MAG: MarR family transcriptional regulator [Candidatus Latescibacterota bacterium]|nr:MAG: MarR family transcriptional regulator [Candidatus Latescibacterota bacterium]